MSWRRGIVGAIVVVLVLAVTTVTIGAVVSVPVVGTSMDPTLRDGDRVVVRGTSEVARFDVVVARFDDDAPAVVKRVVGLPGDRVRIDLGPVVLVQPGATGPWQRVDNPAWPGRWDRPTSQPETTVPPDGLFLLGDHPDASEDSRQLGAAPTRLLVGRVTWRVYPPSRLGGLPGGAVTLTAVP